ncbi:hypothetical protein AOL_s00083g382 [Orbilia oligospora ATCC 24927]|uniref:RING-type domain-containing protein n=1 Tax=Arthrobotrys oligospora (strain ATCC 24927 / CBS 115.81 / DSM 1491) TaxID=756982 RepID=G1XHA1_ARTOA|nr:hypothetical protein AOL_s00083g382 [Orbilia oligospora ATCC 24927]EGX47446.1 hypothetical protein AOL_s00083g382 [Orbilia oligospora ATCC 24927]
MSSSGSTSKAAAAKEQYDLCFITDATGSMATYLAALQHSLPQILALSNLTSAFTSISIIAYRDYDNDNLRFNRQIEFSGWHHVGMPHTNAKNKVDLIKFAKNIEICGGADYPEASKSAVWTLIKNLNPGRRTLCFWYTDAPPHSEVSRSWGGQRQKELAALKKHPIGMECTDWISCCRLMAKHKVQVMSVLDGSLGVHASWYVILSAATNGVAVALDKVEAHSISLVSMDLLMAWLKQTPRSTTETGVMALSWPSSLAKKFKAVKDETPKNSGGFLPKFDNDKVLVHSLTKQQYDVNRDVHHRREAVQDFALHFAQDPEYQALVYETLETIIEFDVSTISLNPVFGELWRVMCAERNSPPRDKVVNAFAVAVGNMADGPIKNNMKVWLEESYNQTKEIERIIASVPAEDVYPAVCIDPTEAGVGAAHWSRGELLEIARSCHHTVLKRLGKVLTKLVFIPSKEECPEHLRDDKIVEKIPFVLANKEHKRQFWKILLHLVLPGTYLSARAGALLAALCTKIGVQIPGLQEAARETLVAFRGKWADIEVGENWSLECMRLLVHCDEKDRKNGKDGILTDFEVSLFKTLNGYKLAELNLDTELVARIPFTPEKTTGYVGPLVKCRKCKHDRSVTIMSKDGICGLCTVPSKDWKNPKEREDAIAIRAETEQGEKTPRHWVECGSSECRCAYVVYDIDKLNVKPKCHYCRYPAAGKAPFVSCKTCTNRVIWPEEYRTEAAKDFQCVFCEEGRPTIVDRPTTARELNKENTAAWIIGQKGLTIGFTGRSIYATVKTHTAEVLYDNISIFPQTTDLSLTIRKKPIQNVNELLEQYQKWISSNTIEYKTCNLCFDSSFKPQDLHEACGRRGCHNKICTDCIKSWYGMNEPGKVVNLNSLHCPFCRREPAAKILRGYGLNVATLAGVQEAVKKRGKWIFGWCVDCDTAKIWMARVCAQGGQPAELNGFVCEECEEEKRKPGERDMKHCPKCSVLTEKMAGCNHITCPCGQHWCYVCGKASLAGLIYDHLRREHGGLFFADNNDDDDDY